MTKYIIPLTLLTTLSFAQMIEARVVKVADGDTITVLANDHSQYKVRILYIDTPEKFSFGNKLEKDSKRSGVDPQIEQQMGVKASEFAYKMIPLNSNVKVDIQIKDMYGRALGVVYLPNGSNYSFEALKSGFACVYRKAQAPQEAYQYEQYAKQNHLGLWGSNYQEMDRLCR